MISRIVVLLFVVMFTVPLAVARTDGAQRDGFTPQTDAEVLRLIRNQKLDLILPGAMRDNNVDMWIHVTCGEGIFATVDNGDKLTPIREGNVWIRRRDLAKGISLRS